MKTSSRKARWAGAAVATIATIRAVTAADVTLQWEPSVDPSVVGYRVYQASYSGTYADGVDAGMNLSRIVRNLTPGYTYYFTVVAYDALGIPSLPSNELSVLVPLDGNFNPSATPLQVRLDEDTSVAVTLAGSDPENSPLTFSVVSPPTAGTLSGTPPNLRYTPASQFFGSDSFTYTSSDGAKSSSPATVSITVDPVNDVPVAIPQSVTLNEGSSIQVTLAGTDIDGDALRFSIATPPTRGTVSGTFPNVIYTPAIGFSGVDQFTFVASDGKATSAAAVVSLTVRPLNTAPVAIGQSRTLAEDSSVAITLAATDAQPDVLTYAIATPPARGTISGTPPNVIYTPAPDYNGTDSFTFVANDGKLTSTPAVVALTVTPVNDRPVGISRTITLAEDTSVPVVLSGTDIDNSTLTYFLQTKPSRGTLSGTLPNLIYTPAANFVGTDSFTFTTYDGDLGSAVATITLVVTQVNDKPVALASTVTTTEDTGVAVLLGGSDLEGDPLTFSVVTAPAKGTLSGVPPNLTYTPAANFNGVDSFTFISNDGRLNSDPATVTITVTPVNDRPVATAQTVTTAEDTSVSITLSGTDIENSPLIYTIQTQPGRGRLSGTPPNLVYTPSLNLNGPDSFTFNVYDGDFGSATAAVVTINVTPVNDVPVATARTVTTPEDTAVAIVLSATDPENDVLTYAVATQPTRGTLSGTAPNLTYTPSSNFNGTDSFAFTANDGFLTSAPATVTVTVTAVNDRPVAAAQTVTTAEDSAVSITLNGSDVEGSALIYAVATQPSRGRLTGTPPNVVYTPTANLNGPDTFTFTVSDGSLGSVAATVTVNVTPVNDQPLAIARAATTSEDTSVAIVLSGTDPENDPLTYAVVTPPRNGTVSGSPPNVTYTPAANYNGTDSFAFTVSDGKLTSTPALVSLTVTAVNDRPVANPRSVTTAEDTSVAIVLTGSDVEGSPLTYTVLTQPTRGRLSGTAPNLTYTPNANLNGSDSFTYSVSDGSLGSAAATVSVVVTAVNDQPVAVSRTVTTPEDTSVSVVLTGTDVEGDALTYAIVTQPLRGTLSGTVPNLTYTPSPNFNGSDSFTFTASDGRLVSTAGTVTLSVTAVNDRPVAQAASYIVAPGGSLPITLYATDVDNASLTYSITTSPTKGRLSGTPPLVTYTPNAGATGADSFAFTASDGLLGATPAVISVSIQTGANNAPVAASQTLTTPEDTVLKITLTATDVEKSPLTYRIVTSPTRGTLSGTLPNVSYLPSANFNGRDSFTFVANDGSIDSAAATVSITVSAVNDAPTATAVSLSVSEDGSLPIVLAGRDADGDVLKYAVVTGPTQGTLTGTAPNLTYVPKANYFGPDSFSFTVNDGTVTSAAATVAINVVGVNDAPVANAQSVAVTAGASVSVVLTGRDADGDVLSYTVTKLPLRGKISGTAPNLTLTADTGYSGADSLEFTVGDGKSVSAAAVVSIQVSAPSVARGDSIIVGQGGTTSLLATGVASVLSNDGAGGFSGAAVAVAPTAGFVVLRDDGTFTYTHNGGTATRDRFVYTARDSAGVASQATVNVSVCRVTSMTRSTTSTAIQISTEPGFEYELQGNATTPAPTAAWQSVTGRFVATAETVEIRDPAGVGTGYYRVRCFAPGAPITTEPHGIGSLSLRTGQNFVGEPFKTRPAYIGRVAQVVGGDVTLESAPWTVGEFDAKDSFPQFCVMVRSTALGSPARSGDWWLINSTQAGKLSLVVRERSLVEELAVGDEVEVRKLTSMADLFGVGTGTGTGSTGSDSVVLMNDPSQPTTVTVRDPDLSSRGYFVALPDGSTVGPLNGATITIYPGTGAFYRRNGGNVDKLLAGRVHSFGLSHYAPASGGNYLMTSAYPVAAPIVSSGLTESGWISDVTGTGTSCDRLEFRNVGDVSLSVYHRAAAGLPTGWVVNSTLDNTFTIPGATSFWMATLPRSGGFIWRQTPPW